MALFENKKKGNSRILKLFGFVIYMTTSGYKRRTQRFLGNLISTLKTEKDDIQTKVTKFLDKDFIKRVRTEDYEKEYFCGNLIKNIDLKQSFLNKWSKYIDNYDNIIILNANSGEIYLFLTYVLDFFIKKYHCKNVLLIAKKKYHMDLINLICPEIPHVHLEKIRPLKKTKTQIADKTFFTMFTGDHFLKVEQDIKANPIDTSHYFDSILENLQIKNEELGYRKVNVPQEIIKSVKKKASNINLNLNNFVFIAPEAASCEEYDNDFWVDLTLALQAKGYDTFFNIVDKDTDIIGCSFKQCDLTFSEAFALAQMSKGVVSLRSGLTESLLQTNVPLFSLYTSFRNRYVFNDMAVEYVLSGFGLSRLPNVNTKLLFEFNMSEVENNNVIENIIKHLKR